MKGGHEGVGSTISSAGPDSSQLGSSAPPLVQIPDALDNYTCCGLNFFFRMLWPTPPNVTHVMNALHFPPLFHFRVYIFFTILLMQTKEQNRVGLGTRLVDLGMRPFHKAGLLITIFLLQPDI